MTINIEQMTELFEFAFNRSETDLFLQDALSYINDHQPTATMPGLGIDWTKLSLRQQGNLMNARFCMQVRARAMKHATDPALWLDGAAASATACRPLYPSSTYASSNPQSLLYPLPSDPYALLIFRWETLKIYEKTERRSIIRSQKSNTSLITAAFSQSDINSWVEELLYSAM